MRAVPVITHRNLAQAQRSRPRRNYTLIAMLLPAVIFLLVMTIYPTVRLVQMSLTNMHMLRLDQVQYIGFDNFKRLAEDATVLNSFKFTAMFVGVGVTAEFILGLAIALFLNGL